jgi:hypothetical protein
MTAHAADKPSTAMPSFFVTTVGPRGRAPLKPGIVGVAVPAMARHVPETFEGLMMEAHSDL